MSWGRCKIVIFNLVSQEVKQYETQGLCFKIFFGNIIPEKKCKNSREKREI